MTTTFFLVRHAAHDNVGGFLAGRMSGIVLGEAGRAQAGRLAERLRREQFAAIHASPRERTQQTAEAISAACGVAPVHTEDALDEIDFGDWSGKTFELLKAEPLWRRWNEQRSVARTPGGESALDVQSRVVGLLERLGRRYRDAALVLVSHADVIKAALCHFLGLPIDAWARFDIAPASISTLVAGDWGSKVLLVNEVVP